MVDGEWIAVGEQSSGIMTVDGFTSPWIFATINLFFLGSIPISVLLIIYKVVRSKQNKKRDIEKMAMQDLE